MALGDVTQIVAGQSWAVEILASAIAANGAPSGASAGVSTEKLSGIAPDRGQIPDDIRVAVKSTAGSGTMTVTLRVWFYSAGFWHAGKALNASSAAPHTAVAIPETGTDTIGYSEPVSVVGGAERIYLEIVAIAGTSTAVTGYAIVG